MSLFDEQAWEERYRSAGSHGAIWSGRPNPQLVDEVSELPAGNALDVGCGEGADAIWLAERGWRVTAVDFSKTALSRAAAHAESLAPDAAVRIEWLHTDLTSWTPPPRAFDLVSSQFMHLPSAQLQPLLARLTTAVNAGGVLLVVGHHPLDMATTMPRPDNPDVYFTAEEVAHTLDAEEWEVVTAEARERTADDPEGRQVAVHDAVLKARRRR
jgi:2-polyprenyl-3-methyl-5-hydroxy-6-metoxy-1,4-benzoquinol methylase